MRYAFVEGEKEEATPGSYGKCMGCGEDVIAKCGPFRIAHWAHKCKKKCSYSEKEVKTQWHINWQNCFPKDWQEVRCLDAKTEEIHIADVKTPNGLVVEFQHSSIGFKERFSRERFHKKMIWVIDGTARRDDFKRIYNNIPKLREIKVPEERHFSLFDTTGFDKIFPKTWIESEKPVFMDFRHVDPCESEKINALRMCWGIIKVEKTIFLISIPNEFFADYVSREKLETVLEVVKKIYEKDREIEQKNDTIKKLRLL